MIAVKAAGHDTIFFNLENDCGDVNIMISDAAGNSYMLGWFTEDGAKIKLILSPSPGRVWPSSNRIG